MMWTKGLIPIALLLGPGLLYSIIFSGNGPKSSYALRWISTLGMVLFGGWCFAAGHLLVDSTGPGLLTWPIGAYEQMELMAIFSLIVLWCFPFRPHTPLMMSLGIFSAWFILGVDRTSIWPVAALGPYLIMAMVQLSDRFSDHDKSGFLRSPLTGITIMLTSIATLAIFGESHWVSAWVLWFGVCILVLNGLRSEHIEFFPLLLVWPLSVISKFSVILSSLSVDGAQAIHAGIGIGIAIALVSAWKSKTWMSTLFLIMLADWLFLFLLPRELPFSPTGVFYYGVSTSFSGIALALFVGKNEMDGSTFSGTWWKRRNELGLFLLALGLCGLPGFPAFDLRLILWKHYWHNRSILDLVVIGLGSLGLVVVVFNSVRRLKNDATYSSTQAYRIRWPIYVNGWTAVFLTLGIYWGLRWLNSYGGR